MLYKEKVFLDIKNIDGFRFYLVLFLIYFHLEFILSICFYLVILNLEDHLEMNYHYGFMTYTISLTA